VLLCRTKSRLEQKSFEQRLAAPRRQMGSSASLNSFSATGLACRHLSMFCRWTMLTWGRFDESGLAGIYGHISITGEYKN
jgi:hypothetical protein